MQDTKKIHVGHIIYRKTKQIMNLGVINHAEDTDCGGRGTYRKSD